MNIVQIKSGGKVELRKDSGSLICTILDSGAVFADLNSDQTLVLITRSNGKVELRKSNGSLVRTIVDRGAVQSRFSGKDILVTTDKGKTELRKENGSFIRTI